MKQFGTEFTDFYNLFKDKKLIIDSFQRIIHESETTEKDERK
jgi:hypothetical protein